MILSNNQELGEYNSIRSPEHVRRVWEQIDARLPKYWKAFIDQQLAKRPAAALAVHFNPSQAKNLPTASIATLGFAKYVQDYETSSRKYRGIFAADVMEEFEEDANAFKSHLAKDVPIIAATIHQKRHELVEWQTEFRRARGKDLLQVFQNIMDFRSDWSKSQSEIIYAKHDDPAQFGLDALDDDDGLKIEKVIGMGIKSAILFHLDAKIFPQRLRTDLYGLYFLSGMNDFGLQSRSSEFLMINDREPASNGSFIMEHNFWYPYGLFSTYALRIFRWLQAQVESLGGSLDIGVRYAFVASFLASVCSQHPEDIKTMRAHDRFEVPV